MSIISDTAFLPPQNAVVKPQSLSLGFPCPGSALQGPLRLFLAEAPVPWAGWSAKYWLFPLLCLQAPHQVSAEKQLEEWISESEGRGVSEFCPAGKAENLFLLPLDRKGSL